MISVPTKKESQQISERFLVLVSRVGKSAKTFWRQKNMNFGALSKSGVERH
jgi:hypothetical protein